MSKAHVKTPGHSSNVIQYLEGKEVLVAKCKESEFADKIQFTVRLKINFLKSLS